jgi:Rnl2 family RNA ligase
MNTPFSKYSSLENTYRQKVINYVTDQGLSDGRWTVSEKVHGANFSFLWNGEGDVEIAKRTAKIKEGDSFYDCWAVYDMYDQKIQDLYNHLCTPGDNLQVYGELFGPGIQKEVWYGDSKNFFAFDIKINGSYLNVEAKNDLFEKFEFIYAKTLFIGSFKECLEHSNEFDSIVPSYLGLDIKEDNVCEGVVIVPDEVKHFGNGGRVVLKNKNDKFSEKAGQRKSKGPKTVREEFKFSEHALELFEIAEQYVCEARLRNVLSKVGEVSDKMFGKILGLFTKDVLEDFIKENESFLELEKPERRAFQKKITGHAQSLIREQFLNILDNEF